MTDSPANSSATSPLSISRQQLLRSTLIALGVAAAILVTVVWPAEYGIDPTGAGRVLGLTAMGESKIKAAGWEAAQANVGVTEVMHSHPRKYFSGRIEIEVEPAEELEYKATLARGEPLLYSWDVQGGPVYFEFHGEPTEGEWPEGFYQSYEIGERSTGERGSFVAPFTGQHGWYWRNLSDAPITIVLQASGYYTRLGRIEMPVAVE